MLHRRHRGKKTKAIDDGDGNDDDDGLSKNDDDDDDDAASGAPSDLAARALMRVHGDGDDPASGG